MAIFDYKALERSGKSAKGLIEAENAKAARLKLKKQGLTVTEIKERSMAKQSGSSGGSIFGGVKVEEITLFTRQLASLIKANIPLVEALTAMIDQVENPKLKTIVSTVRQDVNEGISLSKALAAHPKAFDNIFINMIEAGESSGTLSLVMLRLADLKESQLRLRRKVVGGMTYPALMLVVAVGITIGIFTFVIPKLGNIMKSMNKELPPITQFLMGLSDTLLSYWYLVIGGIFGSITLFIRYINSPKGREWWDGFKLRAPVFGPLFRMIAINRFASTMSTLLGSSVPILTAMHIAKNLVDNVPIARAIENARNNITEGQSIADPLKRSGEFPPMVIHMITIGEKTGELPQMLHNVAANYDEQVSTKIDSLTSLIEPLMIIFMGGLVGFIVISVILPMMDIGNIGK